MYGYKTCFWFLSSLNLVSLLINLLGLQGSGNQESLR
jgi:hypothetical protein